MRNMVRHLTRYHRFGVRNNYWVEVNNVSRRLDPRVYDAITDPQGWFWADDAEPMRSKGNDFVIVWNW